MQALAKNVPAHLRCFVVEQDYTQYTAVDQAVWRFVLLQTHSRLVETAHPAYRTGLEATGISVERIPGIAEMNDRLGRFGWGAVAVDGFIPPRAFQEFQAHGLLPIAADIRSREHLVYTPAPDIIHEAAGHAPILPDPLYSSYLRRIGELGRTAFTVPEENRVYDAIYSLSELKEQPAASAALVHHAEQELARALAAVRAPSEAARLSRLYWWTAEYGLVGRVEDYKLYGAGLLSSLWESHACHAPDVLKLPLDERCLDIGYDVTKPQPQLFVARDFEALHELLDRVQPTLAAFAGGEVALRLALESAELASVEFGSGRWLMGTLREVGPTFAAPAWLTFENTAALANSGKMLPQAAPSARPGPHTLLCGAVEGVGLLSLASESALSKLRDGASGRHHFRFGGGASITGRSAGAVRDGDGRLLYLELRDAELCLPNRPPERWDRYQLHALDEPVGARAGAVDEGYYGDTEFSAGRVPKPRRYSDSDSRLLEIYERASAAHHVPGGLGSAEFDRVVASLARDYPEEWLLRWNVLESLLKRGDRGALSQRLFAELESLELKFEGRQPIASGLRYLARLAG
jgi:phenylalanine-4-hydroxylase